MHMNYEGIYFLPFWVDRLIDHLEYEILRVIHCCKFIVISKPSSFKVIIHFLAVNDSHKYMCFSIQICHIKFQLICWFYHLKSLKLCNSHNPLGISLS